MNAHCAINKYNAVRNRRIPLLINEYEHADITKYAEQLGISRTALIRMSVKEKIAQLKKQDTEVAKNDI